MGPAQRSLRSAAAAVAIVVAGLAFTLVGCGSSAAGGSGAATTRPAVITTTTRPAPTTTRARATTTVPTATSRGTTGLPTVAVSQLPPEARETLALIDRGGPFPHAQDGVVFQNRERILPRQPSGYYHEYTVETPGSADRGARRIVTGGDGEQLYTDDHYASFREIVDG